MNKGGGVNWGGGTLIPRNSHLRELISKLRAESIPTVGKKNGGDPGEKRDLSPSKNVGEKSASPSPKRGTSLPGKSARRKERMAAQPPIAEGKSQRGIDIYS